MATNELPCGNLQTQTEGAALRSYAVTPDVLLASQPQIEDWAKLVEQGYRTVINLRSDPERAAEQGRNAEAAGLRYLHTPWPAYELEPEHVEELAAIVENPETGRLVFHCRSATRVGLMWMLYRQQHHGWTREQAEAELRAAGYDDDSMETFGFCADDYMDRVAETTK
ncbi:protein tyrosine phosphatase family protein [Candidatus Chloroploca sp. Khr17]|uniref:protein tyrosine phosphatase family protein n=1 Tax=Candidatus Chloroploca sp. Khr17 TaxID=2496869 RepID=UPI00101E0B52|nr:protein tyrosine phosphatase family protein [Candidatus Chloroploca sp. Khr17]